MSSAGDGAVAQPARSSREQFDRQAAHYDAEWNRWNRESLPWMLAAAGGGHHGAVLDVATGAGFTALAFAHAADSVVGVDVSQGMLDQARHAAQAAGAGNVTFQEGAAEQLPFDTASFDIVLCRIAAHHFLSVPRFLDEAYRVLRPGGRLVMVDTASPEDRELDAWLNRIDCVRDPSHVRNYTQSEWQSMLADAGFRLLESSLLEDAVPIELSGWLRKAGCSDEQRAEVHRMIDTASPAVRAAYRIHAGADGDTHFSWWRVAVSAEKPAR